MLLRPYTPADFEPLYAIEEACFESPLRFTRRYLRSLAGKASSATWVAELDGVLIGFAVVEWTRRRGQRLAYIPTLEVMASHRQSGLGRELLARLEDSARLAGAEAIWLHVDVLNPGAIRLYEAGGYECEGRQDDFYPQGHAALVYGKLLDALPPSEGT